MVGRIIGCGVWMSRVEGLYIYKYIIIYVYLFVFIDWYLFGKGIIYIGIYISKYVYIYIGRYIYLFSVIRCEIFFGVLWCVLKNVKDLVVD